MIGKGSFSRVYVEGETAIKEFIDEDLRHAVKEIVIMNYSMHPNILTLLSVSRISGKYKLYLKKYDCDLRQMPWKGYARPLEVIISIAANVAMGLNYLHASRIIHADLKPANILFSASQMKAVICDFNISFLMPARKISTFIQTRAYRAPEVDFGIGGSGDLDYSIDIWSYGCILYEMIAERPFIEGNEDDISIPFCAMLGFGGEFRTARMLAIDSILPNELRNIYGRRIFMNDAAAKSKVLDILTHCLCSRKHRITAGGLAARFSPRSFLPREIASLEMPQEKFESMYLAIIDKSLMDGQISPNMGHLAKFGFELRLKKMLNPITHNLASFLEIEYYKRMGIRKKIGTRESLGILCGCIYIIGCARDENYDKILEGICGKDYLKYVEGILVTMKYHVIF